MPWTTEGQRRLAESRDALGLVCDAARLWAAEHEPADPERAEGTWAAADLLCPEAHHPPPPWMTANEDDPVNHPSHYVDIVPGVECIEVVEHFSFLRGNAIKYLWRAGAKGDLLTDLRKAAWYVQREIDSLEPIDVTGRS